MPKKSTKTVAVESSEPTYVIAQRTSGSEEVYMFRQPDGSDTSSILKAEQFSRDAAYDKLLDLAEADTNVEYRLQPKNLSLVGE